MLLTEFDEKDIYRGSKRRRRKKRPGRRSRRRPGRRKKQDDIFPCGRQEYKYGERCTKAWNKCGKVES